MKPMQIHVWRPDMSCEEAKEVGYWERNMLALLLARITGAGWYRHQDVNGEDWSGWSRVISLGSGRVTFHVPDDFDVGDVREIAPNWDGTTTEEKWRYIMQICGCKLED